MPLRGKGEKTLEAINRCLNMHSFFNNLLNFYQAADFRECLARLDSELMHVVFHNVHFVSSSSMCAILIMFQQS